jgi:hypothetical protein
MAAFAFFNRPLIQPVSGLESSRTLAVIFGIGE